MRLEGLSIHHVTSIQSREYGIQLNSFGTLRLHDLPGCPCLPLTSQQVLAISLRLTIRQIAVETLRHHTGARKLQRIEIPSDLQISEFQLGFVLQPQEYLLKFICYPGNDSIGITCSVVRGRRAKSGAVGSKVKVADADTSHHCKAKGIAVYDICTEETLGINKKLPPLFSITTCGSKKTQ